MSSKGAVEGPNVVRRDLATPKTNKRHRASSGSSSPSSASAASAAVGAGYLQSHTELIHGELFADLLEMSQHLHDQGYKDPAAVIAGSSLEAHLRQLCQKSGIDPETEVGKPKNADLLNAELTKANVYSKGDQKSITAWLDLRNKAAHGHYDQYEPGQVGLLISGVRDFITRNPA